MKYGTAIGNWGDVICSLGFFQERLGEGGIVYYGGVPGMEDFLKSQSFIHEVHVTRPKDMDEFKTTMQSLWTTSLYEQGLLTVLGNTEITIENVVNTALNFNDSYNYDTNYPIVQNLQLPEEARLWAQQMTQNIPRPFFVLQPYSINTISLSGHWPYWWDYILWLIQDKSKHYITVGRDWDDSPLSTFNNTTCLVKKTPTMSHVFALAELSDGVITTSNSLAHFCVAQKIKTIVCGGMRNTNPNDFFTKIIQGDSIKLFSYYSKPVRVWFATNEYFDIWPTV